MSNPKMFKYEWVWDRVVSGHPLNAKKQPLRKHENILIFYKKQCTYNPQKEFIGSERAKEILAKKPKKKFISTDLTNEFTNHHRDFYNVKDLEYLLPTDIISFNSIKGECNSRHREHPTQKPLELMEYLVKTYTNEGDMVLDNTMGSGTTNLACIKLNRKSIGIEKDKQHYDVAVRRVSEYCH